MPFGPFLAGAGARRDVRRAASACSAGSAGPDARATWRWRALRIGLTGGIGSGKSTVAALLVALGAAVIDTDAIARELTLPGGAAIDADPRGLRRRRSSTPTARSTARACARSRSPTPRRKRRLEAILHPLIGAEAERQAARGDRAASLVFDVPLLVESGRWRSRVDRVLVVDCGEATQVERVVARARLDAEAGARGHRASRRRARRAAPCADAVIHNDGITLDELATRGRRALARSCVRDRTDDARRGAGSLWNNRAAAICTRRRRAAAAPTAARLDPLRVPVQREHPHDAAARAPVRPPRPADRARRAGRPPLRAGDDLRDHGRRARAPT